MSMVDYCNVYVYMHALWLSKEVDVDAGVLTVKAVSLLQVNIGYNSDVEFWKMNVNSFI